MEFKIPFSGRSHFYTESEVNEVMNVMNDAIPLTQGKYLKEFERNLSDYFKTENIFAVNSATSALELCAQLCQFSEHDEIIIPSHTYTSSAYPFIKAGAKIKWADIDQHTRTVDINTIQQCISSRTKAIVVVHLYGYAVDMEPIIKLGNEKNIIIIEDVAQAIGTNVNDKMAGTHGDYGVFSFHSHKNITTLGEGGALFVKDKKISEIVPLLRHNGHCNFSFERSEYWKPAMGNVDLPELNGKHLMPNNFCIGEVECALGSMLLNRLDEINNLKRKRAMYFIDSLKNYDQLIFHRVNNQQHNYHLLAAESKGGFRDEFFKIMSNEEGIQCAVQYIPLNRYDLYKKLGYGYANCPNADNFFDNMISFPFHHLLKDEEIENIIEATKRSIEKIFSK
tara:strand:+ start:91 stop:1272 length:1182 start_codon:yes stop_codon:yes gene_type:complete